ncbi:MAG: Fur family transcriptional regulator [Pseudomonadota bacterium]
MSEQRRLVCAVLEKSIDHPDAELLCQRARETDPKISRATVYRTLKSLEEQSLVWRHDFGDSRSRFEIRNDDHHDHLIDLKTGKVIEFHDPELEKLKARIAKRLGYDLKSHSLELYGHPSDK